MFEEPIMESMLDHNQHLTLDQKLQTMNFPLKTLSEVKEKYKYQIDYSTLQERKFNLRKTRQPIIIFSSAEIEIPLPRTEVRVKSVISPEINQSLLFVSVQPNNTKSRSLGFRKKRQ
ncbi:unnamed protein product [Paramecium primaurelia]|uniref:Uncharacterized protein n=2 Tax=Paramecium TaxID=5884 RepID=A0A8S1WXU1_9CILI|nr:unnamed protein product [Paramecium primaurelia]CAD8190666.1 unnamed protein product [Paramecium pentaurelia]